MASLMESRWAATSETKAGDVESSENVNGKKEDAREEEEEEEVVEVTGMGASRWAGTTDPEEEKSSTPQQKESQDPWREPGKAPKARDIEALAKELASQKRPVASGKPTVNDTSADNAVTGSPIAEKQTETKVSITPPEARTPASDTSPVKTPQLQRSESTQGLEAPRPRLKTRVSWRGRNIVIAIPRHDYAAAGAERPMSREEIAARLQHFEHAGYDTSGFDLEQDVNLQGPAQVRSIFPDEAETRQIWDQDRPKVVLPDLDQWKRYMDWLTEQKLAALGVSLGFDDPSPTPVHDMSRQSSGQYPPLPFSPPIPTGSAGGMRPMGRGHSHTMSVASPVSPMGGPMFGHAHRHSTFTGAPMNHFQMPHQPPLLSPNLSGMPPYSPQQHFAMPRGGSPAQLTALRQDLGNMRGPGSPLGQHMMSGSPQDYSRGMMDQQRRQHGYSQSMAAPVMRQSPQPPLPQARYTPAPLPELPEEDDEEELREPESEPEPQPEPEPQAYVPPQKRVQAETEIVVPTPRGHRHNISDALEREVLETERPPVPAKMPEQANSFFPPRGTSLQNQNMLPPLPKPVEKDPLSADYDVHESPRNSKKSAARLNVAAATFTFNPGAVFEPGNAEFTFGAPATKKPAGGHRRDVSSGSLNVNAPSFKPASSEFSFSSVVPPSAKKAAEEPERTIVDDLPSIFDLGKIKIPDIVKPARRNKAIPILRPEESDGAASSAGTSGTEYEDADGRVAQGEAKRKQKKKAADDGDSVPLFAEPSEISTPIMLLPEQVLGSNVVERSVDETTEDVTESTIEEVDEPEEETSELEAGPVIVQSVKTEAPQAVTGATEKSHSHRHSTSLSALAKPFEPPVGIATTTDDDEPSHEHSYSSISELEDGEIRDDDTSASTLLRSDNLSIAERDFAHPQANIKNVQEFHPEPSFDEIDAVMMQLNAQESEEKESSPVRLPSPGSHPMKGVTYLADWHRSDGPTPSPRRRLLEESAISGANGWGVHQLNRAEDVPTSDWSGMLSPVDEAKLQERGAFFDSHIAEIIGRAMHARLAPLEELILSRNNNASRRPKSSESSKSKRTHSNVQSDADDEDDLSGDRKQRPISRGREKRVDQIKVAVLEALREQMPPQDRTAGEIQELHSALADMKISFARAASANLELDDIRAIVEDTMTRQTQAMSQALVTSPDGGEEKDHKRQLSELHGRLNETLAGALEEANQRRAIEEKEAESRRQLRLAQEELQLLRDSVRDDESKERAMEQEREELISRLQVQGEALRSAEDKLEDTEAQNEALQATLSEYRTSSKKWREDIEEGKRVREELENTLSLAQRQAEDSQDATSGMRRRLEKLHADMATAVGQLASEKAAWKSREEEYRRKVESLEERLMVSDRGRIALDEELRTVRVAALEASETRHTLNHVRESHASLEEMNRKLQAELAEQRGLAAHYERQWQHAQESGQAEVNRVNMSKETEVEAAKLFVRAELEMELTKARTEVENLRMEAENTKERHAHMLEQEESLRREALRKTNHSNSVALDEARHKYEANVQDLTAQHSRALRHALEDKDRLEHLLGEKLSLSDAKVQHLQERVMHLEERLEVTKSAAQAAASSARGGKAVAQPQWQPSGVPEKISPQALRESILVLQEQLQEREARIERLQAHAEGEGATKLKQRDDEINFLRELLAVRNEELTDLVNTISKPNFDRAAVRDNAIRIRANLQMEQQEKDRFRPASPSQSLSQNESPVGSALASLTNLATPKAAQLSSAFSKWRSNMESSALKAQQQRQQQLRTAAASDRRSYTPSKPAPASSAPAGYHEGLMTPPASNVRSSPIPEDDAGTLPPPRLHPRTGSSTSNQRTPRTARRRRISEDDDDDDGRQEEEGGPATPLFREGSYDRDAEDGVHFEDDGLVGGEEPGEGEGDDSLEGIDDDEGPPAFRRSLEEELGRQ